MLSAQCSKSIGFHFSASCSDSDSGSPIGVTSHPRLIQRHRLFSTSSATSIPVFM
jgi:hypothetical protein